jgi:hypothetical protein
MKPLKNFKTKLAFLLLLSLAFNAAHAQVTAIRGKVIDAKDGSTLEGVMVTAQNTTYGSITDIEGNFNIELPAGTYNIEVSFISFQTQVIQGVTVETGKVYVMKNVALAEESNELTEFVFTKEVERNNESALLIVKQKAPAMLDGISADKISLIGDATAVDAAKRVTGVSIEGGKYVFVRGLGDRYSKTMLNGMDVPGLDPDRNSIQLDLFPTSLVNNILVSKNFTAELPADFTGGTLNIETKSFPDKKLFTVSFGLGYNPQVHLNSNFLSYQGSPTDFLGFDNGLRQLPEGARGENTPSPTSGASEEEIRSFVKSFNPDLGTDRRMSLLDFSGSITYGDQIALKSDKAKKKNAKLGYILSLSYKLDYSFFDDVTYGEYQRYTDPDSMNMRYATVQTGELGEQSTLVGSMAGLAYKTNKSKYQVTLLHLQSGTKRAANLYIDNDEEAVGQSGYIALSENLEYNQRSMTNLLLTGTTKLDKGDETSFEWKVSPVLSISNDPDIRKTAFTITPNNVFFSAGAGGNPSRIWRSLSEISVPISTQFSGEHNLLGRTSKYMFGTMHAYRARQYEILFYDLQILGNQRWDVADPDSVLREQNLYPNGPNGVYYASGNRDENPNEFRSSVYNNAVYASNEFSLRSDLRAIVGLRLEHYVQFHTGRDIAYANGDRTNGRNLANEQVLNTLNLFPSVNFIYSRKPKENLRFSYSKTIARPSLKEVSFAQILDPITNRIFNGSLFSYIDQETGEVTWDGKITETDIQNIDIRWERFGKGGQMVSVSGFYKFFRNPIELVRIPEQQTSTEFQPRNVGNGMVYGAEFEMRKNLDFIPALANIEFSGNVTLAMSQLTMSEIEFEARKRFERTGETVSNKRNMAGQSPYVINGGLIYSKREIGLDVGVFYNVKGRTLEIVGIGLSPDVYTEPFHSLNMSLNYKFGEDQRASIDFKASNILNDRVESFYQSFQADPVVFNSINPNRSFSIGFGYKI